jgi:hypothetical protein
MKPFDLGNSKNLMRDLSQRVWDRRSGDPTHPDNASDAQWQAGYLYGCHTEKDSTDDLREEWEIRGKPHSRRGHMTKQTRLFRNWKAGYWAGRFTRLGEIKHPLKD